MTTEWENYCEGDIPETCPMCGKDNMKDDGEWSCPKAPGFCSVKCEREYVKEQREFDAAAAKSYENTCKLIKEHNAKCPKCVNSEKYCTHQD